MRRWRTCCSADLPVGPLLATQPAAWVPASPKESARLFLEGEHAYFCQRSLIPVLLSAPVALEWLAIWETYFVLWFSVKSFTWCLWTSEWQKNIITKNNPLFNFVTLEKCLVLTIMKVPALGVAMEFHSRSLFHKVRKIGLQMVYPHVYLRIILFVSL